MKLFLVCCLAITTPCFSQNRPADDGLVTQYNSWLKAMKLDQFLQASKTSVIQKGQIKAAAGSNPDGQNIKELVLKPAEAYSDNLIELGLAWGSIESGFHKKGIDIDSVLLKKFACIAFLPINAVSIKVVTNHPDFFYLKIQYHNKLQIKEKTASIRNGAGEAIDFDFNSAAKLGPTSCILMRNNDPINAVYKKLQTYFMGYKHLSKDKVQIDPSFSDNGKNMSLRISYVYNKVISNENYHEVITLDVELRTNELCYWVNAAYAPGGRQTPDPVTDPDAYNAVVRDFPEEWIKYTTNLYREINQTLNAK